MAYLFMSAMIFCSYYITEQYIGKFLPPRIACQISESRLAVLSIEDKENFPTCQYAPDKEIIRGIFSSTDEFKKHRNTIE